MKVLVIGATGFIGRHLAKKLLEQKDDTVFCLVRNLKKAQFLQELGAELIYGDVADKSSLEKVSGCKIDIVFHCAGFVDNKNPQLLHKINVVGTENVCQLCLNLGVKRLIYLSSVAVVSGNKEIPLNENLPYSSTNIYGESKIEAERKVWEYRKKGLPVVILRPPMIYGEDEPHLMKLLLFLLKHRLLPLVNKGKNKLHLAYVENVVAAMLFSLNKEEFLKDSFFVADKEVLTVGEIFTIMSKAIGARPPFVVPKGLTPLLLHLPYAGRRIKFFLKTGFTVLKGLNLWDLFHPILPEKAL